MEYKRLLFLLSLACSTSGCYTTKAAISPRAYTSPSPAESWQPSGSVLGHRALPPTSGQLPEQNEPFSLAELMDIALQHNTETRITWAQARAAAAQYGQSQQMLFPQLNARFDYDRVCSPSFSTPLSTGSTTAGATVVSAGTLTQKSSQSIFYSTWGPQLELSYLIFDFGTTRATSEAYRQALYNADWNHNSAIQTLVQRVLNDFYQFTYQKQLLEARHEDVETARLTLEASELGLKTGVRDISDFLQAKTDLLSNQTNLSAQQQNVEVATAQLLTDMGIPANTSLKTQSLPKEVPPLEIVPPLEQLIAVALQNRPDLLAAEALFKSSAQNLKAAKRQFLPKLNYTFDFGKTYFNGGLHDKYDFDSFFSLSMPLFAGFYYRNAIKNSSALKRQAEERLKASELQVIQDVTTSRSDLLISYETLQFAISYLEAAQEQFRVALAKYKRGTNTILDLTSAQSSLANARAKHVEGLQQWYSSLANLAYATGLISPTQLPIHQESS